MLIHQNLALVLKLSPIYTVLRNTVFLIPQNQSFPGTTCIPQNNISVHTAQDQEPNGDISVEDPDLTLPNLSSSDENLNLDKSRTRGQRSRSPSVSFGSQRSRSRGPRADGQRSRSPSLSLGSQRSRSRSPRDGGGPNAPSSRASFSKKPSNRASTPKQSTSRASHSRTGPATDGKTYIIFAQKTFC